MVKKIKLDISREMAEELVDLKIKLGFVDIEDREAEIEEILSREYECYVGL